MSTKNIAIIAIVIAVIGVLFYLGRVPRTNEPTSKEETTLVAQSQSSELQGEAILVLGRDHIPEGTKVVDYNSNPPTSGNHWPQPADWGFYDSPLPDEQIVHNLEHGGIWISYKDIDNETKAGLKTLAQKYNQAVLVTPRPKNDTRIAVASWGRLLTLDTFNQERIEKFIQANVNNSPEKFASVEEAPVAINNPFPEFTLTEVGGAVLTNESFLGKPSIIWFTTEFCVPCQIGAREVSKLDDELGGNAFDVLVVFVDPRETENDLRSWRKRFARDDWKIAFDNFNDGANSLSTKVGLKYLDSKYLLDKNGVIQNIDFQIANENYLNLIRDIVENS